LERLCVGIKRMLNQSKVVTRGIFMSLAPVSMPSPEGHEVLNTAANAPVRYACFGAFQLDLKNAELFKDGARVKLQGKVYHALLALLQKSGEIVTREELRLQLWRADTHVNYDANVNTTVNKLRQVLGDSPERPAFVETIPRKGYCFVAKVEYVDRPVTLRAPQPAKRLPVAATSEHAEGHALFFQAALHSRWFAAGVVSLVIASMMFGATLVLYAHH
jgi:DNA-binding winged helix-turn-helix (wHTH) protein